MITLTMTLVATVFVMILAFVFGVWMGRSTTVDRFLRPWLDAGQTMPPFVYLIPVLALFGPTRFTAIVAAVVYAAPAAIKIVADGIRGVSVTTIEAAISTGSNSWQIIRKVQIPMAKGPCCSRPTRVCSTCCRWWSSAAWSEPVRSATTSCGASPKETSRARSGRQLLGRPDRIMLDRVTRRAATRADQLALDGRNRTGNPDLRVGKEIETR